MIIIKITILALTLLFITGLIKLIVGIINFYKKVMLYIISELK